MVNFVQRLRPALRARVEPLIARWMNERMFTHENASRMMALVDSGDYASRNMQGAKQTADKKVVFHEALKLAPREGIFAEFGVWKGTTINAIADFVGDQTPVHGFDSFEGLPENWFGQYKKGSFDLKGNLPKVRSNVKLHPGWFDTTAPRFASENPGTPIAFLHIDCDLYSSTKVVFDCLGERLKAGSIILFDEYFNYVGWREHEFKAFQELIDGRSLRYRYIAYNSHEMNVAVQIID